ncbi:Ribonuclease BN, tRNA processing enzyme [Anaerovirgula multivorans]|uniref:Ribonuclease BN, tRNA processing enzyme n=1 Tax=Anaerovirgula multivorans TaxID=312168 RepID=A0A239JUK4_9FIRM|nr:MBL fold metallo-hydrolase [Anaerovirgula multivorans]SNT09108.1 Ribonuclease BN, tRNA processing enzyme [Anaerovirgula multivorans]
MKLTVLGCYGPYPKAGGACSGYLLEDERTKILIDCGNGVLSKLFTYCNDLNKLDAIFISHLHPDHMSDLLVLRYAINIRQMLGKLKSPIPIYLPASPQEDYERIQYNGAYSRNIIKEKAEVMINDIKVTFKKTNHPVECYAMAFEKDKKKFVYSGDTRYFDGLIDFIKESNLFLCEANILHKDMTETIPHLSGKQAAEIALKADLRRIVLTHFLPEINTTDLISEAKEAFPYILELAEEGKCHFI